MSLRWGLLFLATVFGVVACSTTDFGVELDAGGVERAVVGPDGGFIETSSADVDFRLLFPAGAVGEPVEVTVSPISEVDGFPFSGGLLGGVEVDAPGVELLLPAVLEIHLDPDTVTELRGAVDSGMVVFGFGYDAPESGVYGDMVEVSDDLSTIRLRLLSFSGHGAGLGAPEDLGNLPPPSDPFRAAVQELMRILNSGGSPNDPADQIEADIADVLRDLFDSLVLPAMDAALSDPASFGNAAEIAVRWGELVNAFSFEETSLFGQGGLLTPRAQQLEDAFWDALRALFNSEVLPAMDRAVSNPSTLFEAVRTAIRWSQMVSAFSTEDTGIFGEAGGRLSAEGQRLKDAFERAWQAAWDEADNKCKTSGTPEDLQRLIDLDALATAFSEDDSTSRLSSYILTTEGFCLRLRITTIEKPETILEGETATVGFWIEADNQANLTPSDLAEVGITAVFTPADTNIATTSPERTQAPAFATYYETTVTASQAIPGNNAEITITLTIDALGDEITLAEQTITIDITPPPVTCAGDPTTITETETIDIEVIWVTFDGASTCEIHGEFEDQDVRMENIPEAVIAFDIDRDGAGWDDEGIGANWSRDRYGNDVAPGTYTLLVTHSGSGTTFSMRFTVEITDSSTESVTMTVRNVSFSFVSP